MSETTSREDALAAEMVRRNTAAATERAIRCLEAVNVGLHRLSDTQFGRYHVAVDALEMLLRALKFGR